MADYSEDEYLMISGIQHFFFCRRQWALIHIENQWADNGLTTDGELFSLCMACTLLQKNWASAESVM